MNERARAVMTIKAMIPKSEISRLLSKRIEIGVTTKTVALPKNCVTVTEFLITEGFVNQAPE